MSYNYEIQSKNEDILIHNYEIKVEIVTFKVL